MPDKIGAWLRPAMLGPWIAIATGVTIAVFFFGQSDPLIGGRIANWIAAMFVGALWSGLLSGLLIAVDVGRASLGTAMPQGPRAWAGAAVAVAIAWALYELFPPGSHDWGWGYLWAALWPNVLAASIARLVTWRKRG